MCVELQPPEKHVYLNFWDTTIATREERCSWPQNGRISILKIPGTVSSISAKTDIKGFYRNQNRIFLGLCHQTLWFLWMRHRRATLMKCSGTQFSKKDKQLFVFIIFDYAFSAHMEIQTQAQVKHFSLQSIFLWETHHIDSPKPGRLAFYWLILW